MRNKDPIFLNSERGRMRSPGSAETTGGNESCRMVYYAVIPANVLGNSIGKQSS